MKENVRLVSATSGSNQAAAPSVSAAAALPVSVDVASSHTGVSVPPA